MSYLHLSSFNTQDSTKGTISLWFRVSQDSVDKAKQHGEGYNYDQMKWDILRGTIPLITFGRTLNGIIWGSEGRLDCSSGAYGTNPPIQAFSSHPANPVSSPREPSHIGLSCWGHGSLMDAIIPTLVMTFQTQSIPTAAGLVNERVECHYSDPFQFNTYVMYETVAEASYIRCSWPAAFEIWPNFTVTTDKWHHLLVSWDFSTSVDTVATERAGPSTEYEQGKNVHGVCKFYYAFDDENKNGQENISLQPYGAWAYKGPNDVVPEGAFLADIEYYPSTIPTDANGKPLVTGNVDAIPQWHFSPTPLLLSGGSVGLPASAEYIDNVYHVEMAELQFFTDVTIDTGEVSNRRAFVTVDGKPEKMKAAEKLLGRMPDIMLHGSINWQKGNNTGSVGVDSFGAKIPSGQFEPTGRINKYKPDPSLSS